jgi:beta-phosphoglucomutase
MMPHAILVDLDGTLVETASANYHAYAQALAEVGLPISRRDFDARAAGRSWKHFLPEMLAQAGIDADPAGIAARKKLLYAQRFDELIPNTALIGMLRLRPSVCLAALVTNASAVNAHAVLRHIDLMDLFDAIVTGDDVARNKPAPDGYRLAARLLGVEAAQCIVIEDSDIGVASAHAFGAPVLRMTAVPARHSAAATAERCASR